MAGEDDTSALFRKSVGNVRRIDHEGVEPERKRTPPKRRPREDAVVPDPGDGAEPAEHDAPGATSANEYFRPGLQRSVLKKLRRGQYAIATALDLHGMTAKEAHRRLAQFLAHACSDRMRCVRIVTGKGLSSPGMKPVLRPRVAHWLREDPRVLAFTTAPRADGGSGAFYVLLRSRRDRGEAGA